MSDYYDIHTGAEVSDSDAHERFDAYLDEALEEVTVGSLTFDPSRALKELDPIAYRCEFSDWTSDELVESGYWVRVITEDGMTHRDPVWFTDEDDARQHATDVATVDLDDDPSGIYFVQAYDTSDNVVTEIRVVVA